MTINIFCYHVKVKSYLDLQFSVSAIEHAISHMKRGKASGDDQILSEYILWEAESNTALS